MNVDSILNSPDTATASAENTTHFSVPADTLRHYVETLGFGIHPVPRGSKGPQGQAAIEWNKHPYKPATQRGFFTVESLSDLLKYHDQNPSAGYTLVHSHAGTLALDDDDSEHSGLAFAAVGISRDQSGGAGCR
jgi:hypothetical protein